MKRLVGVAVIFLLFLSTVLATPRVKASPAIFIVPDDYPTIQEAVDASNAGDTILVRAGTYYENVVVNKAVSLCGESKDNTIINAGGRGVGICIHRDWPSISHVTITGFKVVNGNPSDCRSTGILLFHASYSIVSQCIISGFFDGIWVWDGSDQNLIDSNVAVENAESGIRVDYSTGNEIINNDVSMNGHSGILIDTSGLIDTAGNNHVKGNLITRNGFCGVYLASSGNTIESNRIAQNMWAIKLHRSSDNHIHHNDFVDSWWKSVEVFWGKLNYWDDGYPSGGNYWSDYTGVDLYSGPNQDQPGSDGIGDTPYVIDANNRDGYPLMNPWTPPVPTKWSAVMLDPFYAHESLIVRIYADAMRKTVSKYLTDAGYTFSYIHDKEVTVEWLKTNLRHGVVFWRGHAGVTAYGVTLVTGEEYAEENLQKYKEDRNENRIAKVPIPEWLGGGEYIGITPKFIEYYYNSNQFPFSLIYAEACEGLKDTSMASAFTSCGAGAFMGYPGAISAWGILGWGADAVAKASFQDFCRKGYNVKQVYEDLWWSTITAGSRLSYYGAPDLRLILGPSSESRSLVTIVKSPVNLYVTDPQGRHIGFDPTTGDVIEEIPDAIYIGLGTDQQVIWIPDILEGSYDVKLLGIATGSFTFMASTFSILETTTQTYDGTIILGQILTSTITITPITISVTVPVRVPPSALINKLSMTGYVKLELLWLIVTVKSMDIKEDVKQGLLDKLTNATMKVDQAIYRINRGNETLANNMLHSAKNIMSAFINLVKAQKGKGIPATDADSLITVANGIIEDIETAKAKGI